MTEKGEGKMLESEKALREFKAGDPLPLWGRIMDADGNIDPYNEQVNYAFEHGWLEKIDNGIRITKLGEEYLQNQFEVMRGVGKKKFIEKKSAKPEKKESDGFSEAVKEMNESLNLTGFRIKFSKKDKGNYALKLIKENGGSINEEKSFKLKIDSWQEAIETVKKYLRDNFGVDID